MSDLLNNGPDLSDPAVLAAQMTDCAAGLETQAVASHGGSAMGGHPYPEFFYRRVASLLLLAADKIRDLPKPEAAPAKPPSHSGPTPPPPATDLGSPPRPPKRG